MKNWTLDDIAWDRFEPAKVDADLLGIVKAAALVERNGLDYGVYLNNVFADDPEFRAVIDQWSREEVQHGLALGRWAAMADPSFDPDAAFRRFTDGYKLPLDARTSVRGSRAGELMARCMVETGTSSYYAALRDAATEPVLRQICDCVARDELRHYKLFYAHMRRYVETERLGAWGRARVGVGRIAESEDDELAFAYYAANAPADAVYDRRTYSRAYARRAYAVYRPRHVERGVAMILKAVGVNATGRLNALLTRLAAWFLRWRSARLARAGA
ncbi:MAG: ferritin-like domain-containing protein [Rhodospirillales bacterium]|nr:MAG: ferritin-like domain-containing protein [Rhodospirillales bacterium]